MISLPAAAQKTHNQGATVFAFVTELVEKLQIAQEPAIVDGNPALNQKTHWVPDELSLQLGWREKYYTPTAKPRSSHLFITFFDE